MVHRPTLSLHPSLLLFALAAFLAARGFTSLDGFQAELLSRLHMPSLPSLLLDALAALLAALNARGFQNSRDSWGRGFNSLEPSHAPPSPPPTALTAHAAFQCPRYLPVLLLDARGLEGQRLHFSRGPTNTPCPRSPSLLLDALAVSPCPRFLPCCCLMPEDSRVPGFHGAEGSVLSRVHRSLHPSLLLAALAAFLLLNARGF